MLPAHRVSEMDGCNKYFSTVPFLPLEAHWPKDLYSVGLTKVTWSMRGPNSLCVEGHGP